MAAAHPATSAAVDEQVLDIVARLANELSGGSARRPVLQDSLDRDLAISSLERVELLLRLEQAFGVRLPDSVIAEDDDGTETPITYGDLATAATALGSGLQDLGITTGDRVALMLRTERAFFESFFGALLIGAVLVPLYPPFAPRICSHTPAVNRPFCAMPRHTCL